MLKTNWITCKNREVTSILSFFPSDVEQLQLGENNFTIVIVLSCEALKCLQNVCFSLWPLSIKCVPEFSFPRVLNLLTVMHVKEVLKPYTMCSRKIVKLHRLHTLSLWDDHSNSIYASNSFRFLTIFTNISDHLPSNAEQHLYPTFPSQYFTVTHQSVPVAEGSNTRCSTSHEEHLCMLLEVQFTRAYPLKHIENVLTLYLPKKLYIHI